MSKESISAQLVVIGAGPGGYAAAFYAADMGMEVVLIDGEANPGGVCLYRGCIPSKALLHIAKVIDEAKEANDLGVKFSAPVINLEKIRTFKEAVVNKLTRGLGQLSKSHKIKFIQGKASFADAKTLLIETTAGEKLNLSFTNLILATGSRPVKIPKIDLQSSRLWSSTEALHLSEIPKNMLVVGGGYIGLELGSAYASLGSQVSVVEMTETILPGVDKDLTLILQRQLKKKIYEFLFKTKVVGITESKKGLHVSLADSTGTTTEKIYDTVLYSVGRVPNTEGLNLGKAQVELNEKGFIKVQKDRQTTAKGIYAIGDVAGNPMLAHKASHEARVAVDAIQGRRVEFNPKAIPAVVFTDPEIAWCGLTEEEAKKNNVTAQVVKFPWAASGRAMTINRSEGMTKIICDPKTDKILGMAIVGPGAGDMISEGVVAMEMCATVADLKLCIHPHPTLSETMMEAAELYYGHCTHLYKPGK